MTADMRPGFSGDDPSGDVVFLERLTAQLDRYADRPRIPTPSDSAGTTEDVTGDAQTFSAIVDGLRAESAWSGPPASLRDLILNQVRDEAASVETLGAPAVAVPQLSAAVAQPVEHVVLPPTPAEPTPAEPTTAASPRAEPPHAESPHAESPHAEPSPVEPARAGSPRAGWWRPRWQRLVWAVPAAGLAAAIFTAGVLVTERALSPGEPVGEQFTATGTSLAVGATATVSISASGSGFVVVVEATGLPAAAPGSYYAAWLEGPRGVVPLGSFHEHQAGGPVRLWSGVDPAEYGTFVVTLQAEGDPPAPSNLVVMRAALHH